MTLDESLAALLARNSAYGAWAIYPNGDGDGGVYNWEVEFFGPTYAGAREKGCGDWIVAAPTLLAAVQLAAEHRP